ncbi:MAG: type I toxin-antitoxin system SymE family toxin [Firmicutes bacterium]|nr:type I toxin-antitoxin system SymE family toxin [Bacillota bacterium]
MKNHRQIVVSSIYNKNKKVPYIRLSGNWLAENGFKIGRKIQVHIKPGSLLLNLITTDEEGL